MRENRQLLRWLLVMLISMPVGMETAPTRFTTGATHPGTDRAGDPLPSGALARLGTLRSDDKRLNPHAAEDSAIWQIEYAPNGKCLAVWRRSGTIEVWQATPWRPTRTLKPKLGRFLGMAFSPTTQTLTTAEGDSTRDALQGILCHWDPITGKRLQEFPQDAWLSDLSYSCDGSMLVARKQTFLPRQGGFVLLDAPTGRERSRITNSDAIEPISRLAADGRMMTWRASRHTVIVWDTRRGKVVRAFGKGFIGPAAYIAMAPDSRTIATHNSNGGLEAAADPDIILWETATGAQRLRIHLDGRPSRQIIFSPNGRLLASAEAGSGVIRVWDAWTGKAVAHFTGHRGWVIALSFAADGKTLASGGDDGTVLIWDVTGLTPPTSSQEPEEGQLDGRWHNLTGTDAARAYAIMAELTCYPRETVALLRDKLTADLGKHADRLARLLIDLDGDDFIRRQNAYKELAEMGRLAEAALARGVEHAPSLEFKRRAEELLRRLESQPENPQRLSALRAIELLERVATEDARDLLDRLAKDAPDPEVAYEARASLDRITRTTHQFRR
jgi:hypothetical protein